MEDRRGDKILEIEKYLEELEDALPSDFEDYQVDFLKKAACERYFEKIVEAVVDLAFIIIKEKELKKPASDKEAFEILSKEKILSEDLGKRLEDAKGMRNIIAHEYGKIDDSLVFHSLTEELINDVRKFLEEIEK